MKKTSECHFFIPRAPKENMQKILQYGYSEQMQPKEKLPKIEKKTNIYRGAFISNRLEFAPNREKIDWRDILSWTPNYPSFSIDSFLINSFLIKILIKNSIIDSKIYK